MPDQQTDGGPRIAAMIVGAQKAATTSALTWLATVPEITIQRFRDLNYFTSYREFQRGWAQAYRLYFDRSVPGAAHILVGKQANLWASPAALGRLKAHNPQTQILVLLRDPVARAISAHRWAVVEGWESSETLQDALLRQQRSHETPEEMCNYLGNGLYAERLRSLWRFFPPDQVSIVFDTDFYKHPSVSMSSFCQRVGVAPTARPAPRVNTSGARRSALASKVISSKQSRWLAGRLIPRRWSRALRYQLIQWNHAGEPSSSASGTASSEAVSALRRFYAPHDRDLMDLLGLDTLPWISEPEVT